MRGEYIKLVTFGDYCIELIHVIHQTVITVCACVHVCMRVHLWECMLICHYCIATVKIRISKSLIGSECFND